MPIFGDYETVGEPVAITDERGHVSTVWQAKRSAGDSRLYAIKCYAPHRAESGEGQAEDLLDKDRGLEFLEGIKQLKKAQGESSRHLTPVHAFGLAPEGAWYATDFYPRTLKNWITLRGRVDHATLRYVVGNIVRGCLALKRSRGHSHGNLKTSNVYLVGKPRPLRTTPIHLADAYPASPLQLAGLNAADQSSVGDLLQQVVEVQDLKAIGEMILQLVEGRLVRSAYDYNYPVSHSPEWDKLGRDGERWRDLCNRLLDPKLSLDAINLEFLAKKFPPPAGGKMLVVAAAVAAVCLAGGGVFLGVAFVAKGKAARFQKHYQAASQELAATNLLAARQAIDAALKLQPQNREATELRTKIETGIESEFAAQFGRARQEFAARNLEVAMNWARQSLELKPESSEAKALQKQIALAIEERDSKLTKLERFAMAMKEATNALNRAEAAVKAGQFNSGVKECELGLSKCIDAEQLQAGPEVAGLKALLNGKRQEAQKAIAASQAKADQYAAAMKEATNALIRAEAAFKAGQFDLAEKECNSGLAKCADAELLWAGPEVNGLRSLLNGRKQEVQQAIAALRTKAEQYATAMKAATNEWLQAEAASTAGQNEAAIRDYELALSKCADAEKLRAGPEVNGLKALLKGKQQEVQQAIKDSQTKAVQRATAMNDATNALNQAATAFKAGQYDSAKEHYTTALSKCDAAEKVQAGADVDGLKKLLTVKQQEVQQAIKDSQTKAVQRATAMNDATNALNQAATAFNAGQYDSAKEHYTTALSKCDAAEKVQAGPDVDGLKALLKGKQQEVQQAIAVAREKYAVAMQEATNALSRAETEFKAGQYDSAEKECNSGLAKCADAEKLQAGPEVTGLKALLNGRKSVAQQAITAAQAKANQYLAAMKEATNAWNRAEAVFKAGQFNPALAEITAALGCCTTARPLGDAGEVGRLEARLKERQAEFQKQSLQAERVRDYGSATNYFAQGRYDEAATLCQRHNGDAEFDALAKQNSVEKSALDSGNQKFADCDYAFVQEWKNLPYSQKQPFVDLINQAIAEAGALQQLIEWQTTTNWIAMKSKLAEPASATFKNKKRFAELDRWALKQQQILDARFEYRLIQFGIIKSDEAKNLASGDVRNAEKARITTDFSLDQKEAYLGEVRQYEDVFRRAGLLNQDDRSRRIQRLRDNINRR